MGAIVFAVCLGAAAVVAQLELLREYLSLAGGNEVAIGLTLAAWLAAGGVGSLAAGRWRRPSWFMAAGSFVAVGVSYLGGVWLLWGGRSLLGAAPGEVVGWLKAFAFAFAAVGPAAFFGGAAFALAAGAAGAAKKIYIAEAGGACLAGLLFTTILYRWITPLAAGGVVFAAAAAAAVAVGRRPGRAAVGVLAALALVAAVSVVGFREALTERWFFSRAFPGEEVLAYRTSPYGAVVATVRAGQYSVYENGWLVASYPDRLAAEETVHAAMLLRPEARRVVLFGGGLTGALAEFGKYAAAEEVSYVELDRALVAAAKEAFRPPLIFPPAVTHAPEDGRRWVRRAAAAGEQADVVIIAMPPPVSAQVNRYFTVEFFREVRRILAPGGLVAVSAPGAANYYPEDLAQFLSSTSGTLAAVFPHVAYLPGERFIFLASPRPFAADAASYAAALRRYDVRTAFLTETHFRYRLTPDRVEAASRAVGGEAEVNADLTPTALYYGLAVWSSRLGGAESSILRAARQLRLWYIVAFAAVLAAPWFIWRRRLGGRPALLLVVAVQGFVEVALEILIIFGYQVVYGAAYLEMALIVGTFMAGLALGGLLPRPGTPARDRQKLIYILGGTILLAFALPPTFYVLARGAEVPTAVVHLLFGGLALAAGACGGAQFVVALRLAGERAAGALYGTDLLGSAAGAVVTAVVLVPVLGLGGAAVAVAVLAAATIAALAAGTRRATA
jgi:spermidine synthase